MVSSRGESRGDHEVRVVEDRGGDLLAVDVLEGGDASLADGRQKSYGFVVLQFNTSASFQLNRGFSPLMATE